MLFKSKALFLSLVCCIGLYAEDNGGFFTLGYELGQVMQDVKNPGKAQADNLARELNNNVTNNVYMNQASLSVGGNIVGALSNAFTKYLYAFLGAYNANELGLSAPIDTTSQTQQSLLDESAKLIINTMVGSGYCTNLTSTNRINCINSGYTWQPSLSARLESNLSNGYEGTSYPNLSHQLSYLTSANVFFETIDDYLKGKTSYTKYLNFIQNQQKILQEVAPQIQEDAKKLAEFNSQANGNNLSAQRFSSLVQGIIDTSKNIVTELDKGHLMTNAELNTTIQTSLQMAQRANGLDNYLANAKNTLQKIINLNSEVKSTPYLPEFRAGNSRQTNIMNGFYTKWGYKQFFGKKRNIGLRYYGFFSYNGANIGFKSTYNTVGLYTYGVGTDVLYNIFERLYQNKIVNMGVFGGIQLAGETFNSSLRHDPNLVAKVHNTHFQFLFDLGFRMNFGKMGLKTKRHRQHTVEIGVQVPTIYNTYYKSAGTTVRYFRPYSVYWSYGYSF
ncbi:outer membrane protein [Helicobacter cetorum]|uniref:Adherence-associated lipoprotein A n=1 Tax=Helicobacter cetorum (strain ATCC BAA-429 / MIT 00-7128) TaxID=182217 RepID=I0ENE2_HELC0|nr:outer membrane protein [Helicobacter cetorum]AFI04461.1 adherence-associated lipoprotein A [Helicobacter cetorum MIT 00-7128]